ncbi:FAD-dependent oxidoreductase [Pseudonocardia sp. NPDC049635]|uniref:FAD-dependent oxidoreductase n=1 Tax=Pseudonocardia sp. NPDC049635 TaxID=3155506 RepID=UPI00340A8BA4
MKIAIIGAGVAGLSTALLLRDSGHDVTVYERADELTEVGAGIQLGPNGARVLRAAGLDAGLRASCVTTTSLEGRRWDTGEAVYEMRYGDEVASRYGAPYYVCHRAVLQNQLRSMLGDERIVLSKEVVGIVQDDDTASVAFADGETVGADLVIGADGIRSAVRGAVIDAEPPVYSGMSAFRGNISADRAASSGLGAAMVKWWGETPDHHMVMYRLNDESVNFVAVVPEDAWDSDSWVTPGDPDDLRARFAGFADPVPRLLDSVGTVYRWALHDRDVRPGWSRGRVVLVGDSCHAMLPFLAQGAVQAIESAAVLARCLAEAPSRASLSEALAAYERTRYDRVARLHATCRGHGLFSSTTDPEFVDWLYRHDATTVPLMFGAV